MIDEILDTLGLVNGATLQSVQRKLGVDTPTAMRLFALREAVTALRARQQEAEQLLREAVEILDCDADFDELAERIDAYLAKETV